MDIAIITNGSHFNDPIFSEKILGCKKKIAIDQGIYLLDELGVIPDLWIVNFNSTDLLIDKKYDHIPKKVFSKDTHLSNTEFAIIEALNHKPDKVFLFSAIGGRIDQPIRDLLLLGKYSSTLYLITEHEVAFAFSKNMLLPSFPQQKVSFLPIFGPVKVSSSEGLLYSLETKLSYESASLLNESIAHRIEVKISKGMLLCIAARE